MKTKLFKTVTVGIATCWFGAASLLAQTGADLAANEGVAATSLDKNALKDILLGKTAYWEGGQAVTIVVLTEKTDAALQELTGMSASQFKTHWQRLAFSGRGKQPKEADTVEKVLALLAENKGAVALVPAGAALPKGVKKIELK
jgi:hypothetical protein